MAVCTFFGHRECPKSIGPKLHATLVELIEDHGADIFYVGRQGEFDAIVRRILKELTAEYPHINYAVVLERLPGRRDEAVWDFSDTIFPKGLESAPPRFAISRRNEWMLKQADFVVAYVTHDWGGAARYAEKARRLAKRSSTWRKKPGQGRPLTGLLSKKVEIPHFCGFWHEKRPETKA